VERDLRERDLYRVDQAIVMDASSGLEDLQPKKKRAGRPKDFYVSPPAAFPIEKAS
jgi:hypothetical protein